MNHAVQNSQNHTKYSPEQRNKTNVQTSGVMLELWAFDTHRSAQAINYVMQMHFNILNALIYSHCCSHFQSPTQQQTAQACMASETL